MRFLVLLFLACAVIASATSRHSPELYFKKGEKYSIEDVTTFPIANAAVSDARKSIKNVINLDTQIQIKMDFINPESAEKFVEKGWDEEKQMYYYLVYFNKEVKN